MREKVSSKRLGVGREQPHLLGLGQWAVRQERHRGGPVALGREPRWARLQADGVWMARYLKKPCGASLTFSGASTVSAALVRSPGHPGRAQRLGRTCFGVSDRGAWGARAPNGQGSQAQDAAHVQEAPGVERNAGGDLGCGIRSSPVGRRQSSTPAVSHEVAKVIWARRQ